MYFADDKDNKKHAVAGDTYVAVTEFGESYRPAFFSAMVMPPSPEISILAISLKMLSEKKLRPALLDKDEILKNLEKTETLSIGNLQ